jgi:hypothetical protein
MGSRDPRTTPEEIVPEKTKRTRSAPPVKPSRIDAVRHLVGVLTDAEVAAKAGVTSSAVHQYRQRHGIAPALPQGTTRRALERRKASDQGRASEPSASGSADDRLAAHVNQLGTVSDDTIARRAKVSVDQVKAAREARGIAAYTAKRGRPPATDGRKSRIDSFRDLVGVLTDPEVAARAGVTRTAVQMYRKKHGIAPAGPPGDPAVARARAPEDAPRSEAPTNERSRRPARESTGGRTFAWRLTLQGVKGELVRITVAEDAAAACARARSVGDVVQVERLAEAIP